MLHTTLRIQLVDDPAAIAAAGSPHGKPFLRLIAPDGTALEVTTNIAEMIGGAAKGLRERYEEALQKAH